MATGASEEAGSSFRVFLITDVRGWTRFTQTQGDAAAARLATKFARIARESVGARGGRVIELRGDEALAVFDSPARTLAGPALAQGNGDFELGPHGAAQFKGIDEPVEVMEAADTRPALAVAARDRRAGDASAAGGELVGRDDELHWLRGTWRTCRRGRGRVVFVSGPAGIGKTRLVRRPGRRQARRSCDLATRAQIGTPLGADPSTTTAALFAGPADATPVTLAFPIAGCSPALSRWNLRAGYLAARACTVARRNLTRLEWEQILPNLRYANVCQAYPLTQ